MLYGYLLKYIWIVRSVFYLHIIIVNIALKISKIVIQFVLYIGTYFLIKPIFLK